jgi:hypothetical protein
MTPAGAGEDWTCGEISRALHRAKVNPHNLLTTNDARRSCSAGPIQLTVVDRRTPRGLLLIARMWHADRP